MSVIQGHMETERGLFILLKIMYRRMIGLSSDFGGHTLTSPCFDCNFSTITYPFGREENDCEHFLLANE